MAVKPNNAALLALSAAVLRDRLASGAVSAVALAEACLERIAEIEPQVQAFAFLDSEHVLAQARALDLLRTKGLPIGPLHGLPVALKDVIDTKGTPTENGTLLDQGRVPTEDAFLVQRLKAAGAVIIGKTVSTELAFLHPGKTLNPHNAAHTPGGSSQGSAAAVAAGMVPLAVGTQTGGSIIRPAAYCGTVGFKPTFGLIPRTGVLPQSPTLDTIGVFARTVEDAALLAEVLAGYDAGDTATSLAAPPRLFDIAMSEKFLPPTFALVLPPQYDLADEDTQLALTELADHLGEQCFAAFLPTTFNEAAEARERINFAEMAKCFYSYERRGWDQLSVETRDAMTTGKAVLARDYLAALDWRGILNGGLEEIFERCDAILTPATPTAAPHGLGSTGSAIFNGLWTLCGTPAVTVPLFTADNGMPMGVQLVGRRGDDARLLRTARWLVNHIAAGE